MEEIICGDTVNGGKYLFVKNRYGKDLAVQLVDCCSPFPIGLELTRQLLTKREMSKFLKYVMATTCCLLQRVDLNFHFEFRIRQHWHNEIKPFLKPQHNYKINNVISKMISFYCNFISESDDVGSSASLALSQLSIGWEESPKAAYSFIDSGLKYWSRPVQNP